MIPTVSDSLDRLLGWISLFGDCDLELNGRHLTKSRSRLPIRLGSSFYRLFTCVPGCIVCCANLQVSLDYIPDEMSGLPEPDARLFSPRSVRVNDVHYVVMTKAKPVHQKQIARREEDGSPYCTFLKPVRDGQLGCSLWGTQTGSPVGCATAYNMRVSEREDYVLVTKQGLSRSWRYDPRPECIFEEVPIDKADLETNVRLLNRLAGWAEYFHQPRAQDRLVLLASRLTGVIDRGRAEEIVLP